MVIILYNYTFSQ